MGAVFPQHIPGTQQLRLLCHAGIAEQHCFYRLHQRKCPDSGNESVFLYIQLYLGGTGISGIIRIRMEIHGNLPAAVLLQIPFQHAISFHMEKRFGIDLIMGIDAHAGQDISGFSQLLIEKGNITLKPFFQCRKHSLPAQRQLQIIIRAVKGNVVSIFRMGCRITDAFLIIALRFKSKGTDQCSCRLLGDSKIHRLSRQIDHRHFYFYAYISLPRLFCGCDIFPVKMLLYLIPFHAPAFFPSIPIVLVCIVSYYTFPCLTREI